jgi:hypothetical protein
MGTAKLFSRPDDRAKIVDKLWKSRESLGDTQTQHLVFAGFVNRVVFKLGKSPVHLVDVSYKLMKNRIIKLIWHEIAGSIFWLTRACRAT